MIKEIHKTLYVTDDGKTFEDKNEALEHDRLYGNLDTIRKYLILENDLTVHVLNSVKVKDFTGFYMWYKVNNEVEENEVSNVIRGHGIPNLVNTTPYPKYIGFNPANRNHVTYHGLKSDIKLKVNAFNKLTDALHIKEESD